jgi:hypothetical protein
MDLETLTIRNRIEDHQIATQFCSTLNMIADIGTKALPEALFVKLRDMMNGYAIVKAKYPDLSLPDYVFTLDENRVRVTYLMMVEMLSQQPFEVPDEIQDENDERGWESEEEEDVDSEGWETVDEDDDESNSDPSDIDEEINESSSVVPPPIPDILEEGKWIPRQPPKLKESAKTKNDRRPRILPHTWEEFLQEPVKHCGHPNFAIVSPQRFYEAVKLWEWNPTTGHIPPNGGSQSFFAQNDTTSDEYTFEELPDPRLYDIDESDLISHIMEQKLSGNDQMNPKLSISY